MKTTGQKQLQFQSTNSGLNARNHGIVELTLIISTDCIRQTIMCYGNITTRIYKSPLSNLL